MKKYISAALICVLLALVLCVSVFASDAVVISTADELAALMQDSSRWAGDYKLGADIDLTGHSQRPIGSYDIPFTGSFDGDGHIIKGLNIRTSGTVGVFGVVGGSVKNLTVFGYVENTFDASSAETKISGKYPGAGGIVGVALSGATVENCTNNADIDAPGNSGGVIGVVYNFDASPVYVMGCVNNGTIYSSAGNCGGVIGRIYISSSASPAVTVKNCSNTAPQKLEVENRNRLGGIVGYIRSEGGVVIVEGCKNTADISAFNLDAATATNDFPYAAGIVGRIEAVNDISSGIRVSKCSNTGNITSGKYAGGIVTYIQRGEVCAENATDIRECINTGKVEAPRYVGGIIAYTEIKAVGDPASGAYNCANYGEVIGGDCAGGICGRQYGFYVEACYSAGNTDGNKNTGALVGLAEGAVYCETDKSYYLETTYLLSVGKSATMCIEIVTEKVTEADSKNESVFKLLDFENIWTMGENGPTLKMLTGESTSGDVDGAEVKSPFAQVREYEGQFGDVTEDKWFYKYVKTAYEYSLANGTSNTAFSPEGKFTVAQALTAAANIHKAYYSKEVRSTYPGESWYTPYVTYCIDNGIIRFGMFDSYDRNITRGEMAIVFANILPSSEYEAVRSGSNPDVTADMECYDAVGKLFAAGIVGGDAGSGNFRPSDEIVRSEACVIFTRIALASERIK